MNKKISLLLIAAFLINSSILTFNVSSKCGPFLKQISEKDFALVGNNPDIISKIEVQKWDNLYEAVKIGKTTQDDVIRIFGQQNPSMVNLENAERLTQMFHLEKGSLRQVADENIKMYNQKEARLFFYGHRFDGSGQYSYDFVFIFNPATNLVEKKFKTIYEQPPLPPGTNCLKPVIYFYPPKEQKVYVRLNYTGDITVSYPRYDSLIKGWNIKAFPDGKIINMSDQEEYSYIFWEGSPTNVRYDMSEGFIVEGEKSEAFLRDTLRKMGLKPREYNEFIVYWYPRLKTNKYNLIHFAHEEYEKIASLEIAPKPNSLLRVFMVYKPLTEKIEIKPQEIKPFIRAGFTVVEWGGTELTQ